MECSPEGIGAVIRVSLSSPGSVSAAKDALGPELNTSRRFSVELVGEGSDLVVVIRAKDLSALRAALNSYSRWLYLIENLDKGL